MTVHTLQRPPDVLSPAARRQFARLFAELDAARHEIRAVELERRTRAPGTGHADLTARYDRAEQRWDDAVFALELGLGKHPNEAAQASPRELLAKVHDQQPHNEPADTPRTGATIIAFPASSGRRDLTAKEVAALINCAKKNGTPRDRFYKKIAPQIGYQDEPGGPWRFPPENVDRYRNTNGG